MPTEKTTIRARDTLREARSRRAVAPVHRVREASLVLNRRRDAATDRFAHLKRVYD